MSVKAQSYQKAQYLTGIKWTFSEEWIITIIIPITLIIILLQPIRILIRIIKELLKKRLQ